MEKLLSFIIDIVDREYHQKKIFSFLNKLDIKIIFDIGAHKGEFLNFAKRLIKFKKIFSFEPQIKIFRMNRHLNKINKISYLNLAISDKTGYKKLKISKKTSTSTFSDINLQSKWYKLKSLLIGGNIKSSFISVESAKTITLDNFCSKKKIKNIDLLKIDTEGHEKQVLIGAKNLMKNKQIKYILIEFHTSKMYKNYRPNIIEKLLKKNKFVLNKKFKFPFLAF